MLSTILILSLVILLFLIIGYYIGKFVNDKKWEKKVPDIRKDAITKSKKVLTGLFSEQLAPFLPDFPWKPTEARFIGKPIDFIIFEGMDEKDIQKVIFVEVKSGKSRLSKHEKNLKDTIKDKKIEWVEYRIPEDLGK